MCGEQAEAADAIGRTQRRRKVSKVIGNFVQRCTVGERAQLTGASFATPGTEGR